MLDMLTIMFGIFCGILLIGLIIFYPISMLIDMYLWYRIEKNL